LLNTYVSRAASSFHKVMEHFLAISAIPRGSGNEEAVSAYIENFAKDRGLFCIRDSRNNVYCRRPASPGYEEVPPVVLQGHMDMVCEANSSTVHNFITDPIDVIRDGDILRANGTTLGADDGVAVAIMLTLLELEDLQSPVLECIFTTEEETGLDGMRHFDASCVLGRRMISLDSVGEGEATAACAGGVRTDIYKSVSAAPLPAGYSVLSLTVRGLAGGHSGEDIHLGRTPAISAMGFVLSHVSGVCNFRLIRIEGGSKDNAIPRECTACIAVSDANAAASAVQDAEAVLRSRLVDEDAGFAMDISEDIAETCYTEKDTQCILSLLRVLPIGVRAMSRDIPGLVETSANLGVIKTTETGVQMTVSSRSSVESQLDEMQSVLEHCATLAGAEYTHRSRYPGWAFRTGSVMQDAYRRFWSALFGSEGRIIGIHAGLECGLFTQKIPDMDIISIGPDIKNLHSPDETVTVSSFQRLYTLVMTMLAELR